MPLIVFMHLRLFVNVLYHLYSLLNEALAIM